MNKDTSQFSQGGFVPPRIPQQLAVVPQTNGVWANGIWSDDSYPRSKRIRGGMPNYLMSAWAREIMPGEQTSVWIAYNQTRSVWEIAALSAQQLISENTARALVFRPQEYMVQVMRVVGTTDEAIMTFEVEGDPERDEIRPVVHTYMERLKQFLEHYDILSVEADLRRCGYEREY